MEHQLSDEQAAVMDDIRAGKNLLITGPGGTGKSFLLERVRTVLDSMGCKMDVCGSTGISAVNVGGVTLHSWAGIGLGKGTASALAMNAKNNPNSYNRIRNAEVLAIDEISMIEAALLDKIDTVFQFLRENDRPFGGVQVLTFGDFCLKTGTKVVMADGSLRRIEDVLVGESLMGPDSKPRLVSRLFRGSAPLFKVKQTNAEPYVVTRNHLLAMKRRGNSRRMKPLGDVQFLKPEDAASRSGKFHEVFAGYKADSLRLPPRPVPLEPYFMGLWLGDGDSATPRITTSEPEVISYLDGFAKRNGVLATRRKVRSGCPSYTISLGWGNQGSSGGPIQLLLKEAKLLNRKHIPEDYLLNCENSRLQLLAGLLDTDGTWSGNRFVFSSSRETLARQAKHLADHLGFRTNLRVHPTKLGSPSWDLTIGGDTWRIPTKVPRKQSFPRNLGRSRTTSKLSITPCGEGEFAGVEIDGDHLFLLADGTVVHNCQLPPVEGDYAFESKVWKEAEVQTRLLTHIFRQEDAAFAGALMELRRGELSQESKDLLNSRYRAKVGSPDTPPVFLTTHNDKALSINNDHLLTLPGEKKVYLARDTGTEAGRRVLEKCKTPSVLELKRGARVLCCTNLAPDLGIMNGSAGTVTGEWPVMGVQCPRVQFDNGEEMLIPKVEKEISLDGKVIAKRTQFPLRLGWALTAHSAQGSTLDLVEAHLGRAFERGQVYVALSRVRTLEGLSIMSLNKEMIKPCPVASAFYDQALLTA